MDALGRAKKLKEEGYKVYGFVAVNKDERDSMYVSKNHKWKLNKQSNMKTIPVYGLH